MLSNCVCVRGCVGVGFFSRLQRSKVHGTGEAAFSFSCMFQVVIIFFMRTKRASCFFSVLAMGSRKPREASAFQTRERFRLILRCACEAFQLFFADMCCSSTRRRSFTHSKQVQQNFASFLMSLSSFQPMAVANGWPNSGFFFIRRSSLALLCAGFRFRFGFFSVTLVPGVCLFCLSLGGSGKSLRCFCGSTKSERKRPDSRACVCVPDAHCRFTLEIELRFFQQQLRCVSRLKAKDPNDQTLSFTTVYLCLCL